MTTTYHAGPVSSRRPAPRAIARCAALAAAALTMAASARAEVGPDPVQRPPRDLLAGSGGGFGQRWPRCAAQGRDGAFDGSASGTRARL